MPTPVSRPSLTTDLSSRYATQKVGGAFDAKNIIEGGVAPAFASLQGVQFQVKNGFLTEEPQNISNFKNDGGDLSIYAQGLNTTKYVASFPS